MQTLILNHYPPVIKQIKEIQQIAKAEDIEFSKLNIAIRQVLENMFISTANETGVVRFEALLGIIPQKGQNLDERKLYILFMLNRQKMSLREIQDLLAEYTKEVELIADYAKEELIVKIGDDTHNTSFLFKILNDIMPLQIYIFLGMEIETETQFMEIPKELILETAVEWENMPNDWYLDGSVQLDGSQILNASGNWYLNGSMLLNGSRMLNATDWKQPALTEIVLENTIATATDTFEDTELTAQKNLWYLDGSVQLDGSRIMNAEIYKEVV